MLDVLPAHIAATYTEGACDGVLRPAEEVLYKNITRPQKPARVAGSRGEYIKTLSLRRLLDEKMIGFTAHPKAINGVFAVGKDGDTDRLIIDAQPANRLFIDSPRVFLPNPSHLIQLRVPRSRDMSAGKSYLSNFFHHIGLPSWMQQVDFALPSAHPR